MECQVFDDRIGATSQRNTNRILTISLLLQQTSDTFEGKRHRTMTEEEANVARERERERETSVMCQQLPGFCICLVFLPLQQRDENKGVAWKDQVRNQSQLLSCICFELHGEDIEKANSALSQYESRLRPGPCYDFHMAHGKPRAQLQPMVNLELN